MIDDEARCESTPLRYAHTIEMKGNRLGRGLCRLGCVVSLAGCATTGSQRESDTAASASRESEAAARAEGDAQRRAQQARSQQQLRQWMQRESSAALEPRAVRVGDAYEGAVASAGDVTMQRDGDTSVAEFSIGASAPVQCIFSDEIKDQANLLRAVYEDVRRTAAATQIAAIDAGASESNSYIDLHFAYRTRTPAGERVGYMKMRSLTSGDRSVLCMHDEPGFLQTFHRATLPLLRTTPSTSAQRVLVVSLNGNNVGTMSVRRSRDEQDTIEDTTFSTLLARTPVDLLAEDRIDSERFDARGELAARVNGTDENGAIEQKTWQREAATLRYPFEGTHLGRPLRGVVTTREPLRASAAMVIALVRDGVVGRTPAVEREELQESNPLVTTRSRIELVRREGPNRAWIRFVSARDTLDALVDEQGLPLQARITVGTMTLALRAGTAQ